MMITALVEWTGRTARNGHYSRAHSWVFDGGQRVAASSSPDIVPVPFSDPAGADPEEALLAAAASCHMLFFLHLAAAEGHIITRYHDHAQAEMGPDEQGRLYVKKVTLTPDVTFNQPAPPRQVIERLHEAAHEQCFIANSLRAVFEIVVR